MNLARRTKTLTELRSQDGAGTRWILARALQLDAQAGLAARIMEELCRPVILADDEIHSPIPVKVAEGRSTLFAIHLDSNRLARPGLEVAFSIALQQERTTR